MQVRDVMTRTVVTVGPDGFVKQAAEVMAERGFAALPVVDGDRLVGMVAEADVLRDRIPSDPRLHLRRADKPAHAGPPLLVRGVMTTGLRTVEASADVADVARLFVDGHLRSVPVMQHDRMVGIVSRRDLLRAVGRSDDSIRADLLRLVEEYTGEVGSWDVRVTEGVATIRQTGGAPEGPADVEEHTLEELAVTVAGVVTIRVLPHRAGTAPAADAHA